MLNCAVVTVYLLAETACACACDCGRECTGRLHVDDHCHLNISCDSGSCTFGSSALFACLCVSMYTTMCNLHAMCHMCANIHVHAQAVRSNLHCVCVSREFADFAARRYLMCVSASVYVRPADRGRRRFRIIDASCASDVFAPRLLYVCLKCSCADCA